MAGLGVGSQRPRWYGVNSSTGRNLVRHQVPGVGHRSAGPLLGIEQYKSNLPIWLGIVLRETVGGAGKQLEGFPGDPGKIVAPSRVVAVAVGRSNWSPDIFRGKMGIMRNIIL